MKTQERVLWGVRTGNEDWQEEILSTNPKRFDEVRTLAQRDGFGRFRMAVIDLRKAPDFSSKKLLNF